MPKLTLAPITGTPPRLSHQSRCEWQAAAADSDPEWVARAGSLPRRPRRSGPGQLEQPEPPGLRLVAGDLNFEGCGPTLLRATTAIVKVVPVPVTRTMARVLSDWPLRLAIIRVILVIQPDRISCCGPSTTSEPFARRRRPNGSPRRRRVPAWGSLVTVLRQGGVPGRVAAAGAAGFISSFHRHRRDSGSDRN